MTRKRVLVVDDDAEMRDAVARILADAGYVVEQAVDGDAAVQAQRARPADVLITDVFMPTRDGLETIQFFHAKYPAVPIIAMTGGSPTGKIDEYLQVAKVAGARATLRKPFAAQALLDSVSAL
jgi:CheY-like chemotaxis protein